DLGLDATVAVKVLNPRVQRSASAIKRFNEEAKRLTQLTAHPNIVQWLTFDSTDDGLHYFVMEFLSGKELSDLLDQEGPLEPERVGSIVLDVLSALIAAHELPDGNSLLHLDLKPQNVFLVGAAERGAETAKVIDFGIGQHTGEVEDGESAGPVESDDLESTIHSVAGLDGSDSDRAGSRGTGSKRGSRRGSSRSARATTTTVRRARGGTALYASPEQCKHLRGDEEIERLDGRSDLYSLGVMAFRALTGRYPFRQTPASVGEAFDQHLGETPARVRDVRPKVPRRVARVVDRCLAKEREERWQSARDAHAALERAMQPLVPTSVVVGTTLMSVPILAFLFYWIVIRIPPAKLVEEIQVVRVSPDGSERPGRLLGPDEPIRLAGGGGGDAISLVVPIEVARELGSPGLFDGEYRSDTRPTPLGGLDLVEVDDVSGSPRFAFRVERQNLPLRTIYAMWGEDFRSKNFEVAVLEPRPASLRAQELRLDGSKRSLDSERPIHVLRERIDDVALAVQLDDVDDRNHGVRLVVAGSGDRTVAELRGREGRKEASWALSGLIDASLSSGASRADAKGLTVDAIEVEERTGRILASGAGPFAVELVDRATLDETSLVLAWLDADGAPRGGLAHDLTSGRSFFRPGPECTTLRVTGRVLGARTPTTVTLKTSVSGSGRRAVEFARELGQDGRFGFALDLRDDLGLSLDEVTSAGVRFVLGGSTPILGQRLLAQRSFETTLTTDPPRMDVAIMGPTGAPVEVDGSYWLQPGRVELAVAEGESGTVFGLFELMSDGPEDAVLRRVCRAGETIALETTQPAVEGDATRYELRQFLEGSLPAGDSIEARVRAAPRERALQDPRMLAVVGPLTLEPRIDGWEDDATAPPVSSAEDARDLIVRATGGAPILGVEYAITRNGRAIASGRAEVGSGSLVRDDGDPRAYRVPASEWASIVASRYEGPWADGRYELEITSRDAAGNETEAPVDVAFHIDGKRPRIVIQDEDPVRLRALLDEVGGRDRERLGAVGELTYAVRCSVSDGNGVDVSAVEAVLDRATGRSSTLRTIALGSADAANDGTPEALEVCFVADDLGPDWSGKEVSLRVEARDRRTEADEEPGREVVTTRLGRVYRPLDDRVAGTASPPVKGMTLVRGPGLDAPFEFPGRQLPAGSLEFGDGRLRFEPLDIEDFYLDTSEVTNAEFLAFVEDENGYGRASNWPRTPDIVSLEERGRPLWGPDSARRRELLDSLAGRRPGDPVVGVWWEEASAYARWAGKRLPTLLELEYAWTRPPGELPVGRVTAGASAVGPGEPGPALGALWTRTPHWKATLDRPYLKDDESFCRALLLCDDGCLSSYVAEIPRLHFIVVAVAPDDERIDWRECGAHRRPGDELHRGFLCARSVD
ncbi:MAG: SUMF1/EgtB/PvdO family nonheme iron enzyme, partial [Planctomycetota bacterium]